MWFYVATSVAQAVFSHKRADRESKAIALRMGAPYLPTWLINPSPSRCPCCGSRDFRPHKNRLICSYCRSGQ